MTQTTPSKEREELKQLLADRLMRIAMGVQKGRVLPHDLEDEAAELATLITTREQALLDRVGAALSKNVSLDDIYGTDRRNNYGYNETQVRDAARWLQSEQRQALNQIRKERGV